MPSINSISNQYVADLAAASPITATFAGLPGHDDRLDDLSPDGLAERNELSVAAVRAAGAATVGTEAEAVASAVLLERLEIGIETYRAGLRHADLNVMESPLQNIRMIFDLMATDTEDDWATISRRMAAVPSALAGYQSSLRAAAAAGQVSAVRQIEKCAIQCANYGGSGGGSGFFAGLAAEAGRDGALGVDLHRGAAGADAAYRELGSFLTRELLPLAPSADAVGEQRYALALREFTGATLDLEQTYAWGWAEFLSLEAEVRDVCRSLNPNATPAEVAADLDRDPRYLLDGVDALQAWMQNLSDTAIAELGRTHFEIPDAIRTLECRIAPPGGGVGAYYTGPSDDLSRPGRMWWSIEPGRQTFTSWRDTSVVYHEGVPGHHLQIATQVYQREQLNDFQRLLAGTSGHAEGWALYAERLVRELGYLDEPAPLLGMLSEQLFRAARVVLDIGMHLEYRIPAGTGFHEGQRWTPTLGLEFLQTRTLTEAAHGRDEIDRYLGWPGQAPSYKVGERVWRQARDAARLRHPDTFDLKAFHTAALNMGGMGLDPLAHLLSRL